MAATIEINELPLTEAAAVLRMTPEAVRMRWRRGKLKGRRDEAGRVLIAIETNGSEQLPGQDRSSPGQAEIVEVLKAQVVDLQKRLDAADQAQSEMRRLLLQSQSQVSDLTQRLASLPAPGADPIVESEQRDEAVESSPAAEPVKVKRTSWLWPWG